MQIEEFIKSKKNEISTFIELDADQSFSVNILSPHQWQFPEDK